MIVFTIHTNKDSRVFCQKMCAYITGHDSSIVTCADEEKEYYKIKKFPMLLSDFRVQVDDEINDWYMNDYSRPERKAGDTVPKSIVLHFPSFYPSDLEFVKRMANKYCLYYGHDLEILGYDMESEEACKNLLV